MAKKVPLVSIITTVYNDRDFILKTVEKFEKLSLPGLKKEIIFVDDYSTDGSREVLRQLKKNNRYKNKYKIIFHKKNKGLGGALKTGFKAARGDYLVRQDVDLEYDVKEIPYLLKPLLKNKADIVYGSRTLNKINCFISLLAYL